MTDNKITVFAERLMKLTDDYKSSRVALLDEARNADIDPSALARFVGWSRKSEQERLEQEALDHQYRYLAGLHPEAVQMPAGSELARATSLYAADMPVRAVAKEMGISVGKAHKLKVKAAAFTVQPHVNMNAEQGVGDAVSVPTPETHAAARREPKAGKEQPVEDDRPGNSGLSTPPK